MSAPVMAAGPAAGPVQEQLDRISAQLSELAAVQAAERQERERRADLLHELMPVAQAAMQLASDELEELSRDVGVDDAVRFARTAARSLPQLETLLVQLVSVGELMHEVNRIAGAGVASVSDLLADAERRGWFSTARHGATVAGQLASAFDQDWPHEPPSALALLRSLRDPQARLGLARAISLLRALGTADGVPGGPAPMSPTPERPGKE